MYNLMILFNHRRQAGIIRSRQVVKLYSSLVQSIKGYLSCLTRRRQ